MIDVHPPHQATHTWRDFFIHIATISVGLLIAIGLEQSVEALHRLHERHILEHDLREECEEARRDAENNLRYFDARILWMFEIKNNLDTMIAANGKADQPYRRFQAPPGTPTGLNLHDTVWVAARSEGKLALLSDVEERAYGSLYIQIEHTTEALQALTDAGQRQRSLEDQFSDLQHFGVPVFSRMSVEQLVEYRAAVVNALEDTRNVKQVNAYVLGATDVLLHSDLHLDRQTLEQMLLKTQLDEAATHRTDFDAMAKRIEAQDAARDKAAKKDSAEGVKHPQPVHAAHS